jgi:hypothetical protein
MTVIGEIFHNSLDREIQFFPEISPFRYGKYLADRIVASENLLCKAFGNDHGTRTLQHRICITHKKISIKYLKEGTVAYEGLAHENSFFMPLNYSTGHR